MTDKNEYDYFYGTQSEQFSFFRLPKIIVRNEKFRKISSDAKILYGIMLDRMSLSRENGWFDKENRVYIIFTLNDVMKEFECSQRKASMLMAELDTKSGVGLIEKKRQGLGKPNLIYLKNFIAPKAHSQSTEKPTEETTEKDLPLQSGKNMQLRISNDMHLQRGNHVHPQCSNNLHPQCSKDLLFQKCRDLPPNNTEYNNTYSSKNESIHPIHQKNEMDNVMFFRNLVKENICYENLTADISILKRQMLDEILEIIVEVLAINRKSLRIAGADYPYPFVKNRFLCIGQDHIEYVLSSLEQTSGKIGNIKAYLLTCLFNATSTIDTYYITAANHDLAEGHLI